MLKKHIIASLAATCLVATPAFAQTTSAPPAGQMTTQPGTTMAPGAAGQSTQAPMAGANRSAMAPLAAPGQNHMLGSDFEGTRVYGANNENIGDISDTLIDRDGRIVAVVVGVGGFLGIGQKDVAIPFEALEIVADNRGYGTTGTAGTAAPATTGTATAPGAATAPRTTGTTGMTGTAGAPADTQRQGTINPNRIVLRGMTKQDLENAPEFDANRTADAGAATGTQPRPATGTAPARP
jgi:sporulation protein YlmC with PRC-barrel domain